MIPIFFFEFFENFSFVSFFRKQNPVIGRVETIRLVQKSSNFKLSSQFFGRLKIFVGLGSLYCLEPLFQTPHYHLRKKKQVAIFSAEMGGGGSPPTTMTAMTTKTMITTSTTPKERKTCRTNRAKRSENDQNDAKMTLKRSEIDAKVL